MIKDYGGGKIIDSYCPPVGHVSFTNATILKKNKVTEAVKGSASLTATRLTKLGEGPISDVEKLLMTHRSISLSAKAKSLWCWKKRLDLTPMLNLLLALGILNDLRIIIHYIL